MEAAFGDGKFAGAGVRPATPTAIATNGTTTLAELEVGGLSQNGDAYELNPLGGTGGPLLELNGSVVTKGQFRGRLDAGRGAARREMGTKSPSSRRPEPYVVWNTDSNGDYTGNATGIVSGTSSELEGVEAAFGETFAGAGAPATTNEIGTNGQLAELGPWVNGNVYELNPAGGGTGPLLELMAAWSRPASSRAGWTPVGAHADGRWVRSRL